MANNIEKLAHDTFESIKQIDNDGNEFWYARALAKVLDYAEYRNFLPVIQKAKIACEKSDNIVVDHFVDMHEMVQIGSGAVREMESYALSRYACYLIVQNGDSSKPIIANGQTYFAIQTRRQELLDQQNDVEERLEARAKLRASETELSENIYQRGVDDKGFGRIRSKGDGALFGGFNTSNMKSKLNVPKNRALADFLPTVTITAKNLATEITNHNVKQKNLQGETNITDEHIENNTSVRGLLVERGIKPENLPASEDIKRLERKTNRLPQEDESPKLKVKKND
jgi:DNA-damage-inducible protein D